MIELLTAKVAALGLTLLKAIAVFVIGKILIKFINKLVTTILQKRNIDLSVKTFVSSLTNVSLMVLLIISVIGVLGVETSTFAALIASAGVAIGMALSGNLSNFVGGLLILIFKPFKVGDVIETQGVSGAVDSIQIFHTVLKTPDNKTIFMPNGSLSNAVVVNYSKQDNRRVDWSFGVDYGEDFNKVKQVIEQVLKQDSRILQTPAPAILLGALADSSVNVSVRVWVKNADYWDVFFEVNQAIYAEFNRQGIDFPFPQLTVHNAGK